MDPTDTTEPNDLDYRRAEVAADLAQPLARAVQEARAGITYRWLERIEERVDVDEKEVFPSEDLLDHVPLLIGAVADFMEDPADEGTAADEVMAKAAELGEIRFRQGYSTYQVLKEFEALGGVILSFLRDRITELGFTPEPDDVLLTVHRVYRALSKVQQATAARHIGLLEQEARERDQRLRLIRSLTGDSLDDTLRTALEPDADDRARQALRDRLRDVRRLASTDDGSRRKGAPLAGVLKEAVRRVEPVARDSTLELRVREPLPDAQVPDAEVEQCLVIYLTNALRYCARVDEDCWVEVAARRDGEAGEVVVSVRNTGEPVRATDDITTLAAEGAVGDPASASGRSDSPATPGVGLRLARDLIRSLGGRTWAEPASDPDGSVFNLALPARRAGDADTEGDGGGAGG